MYLRQCLCSAFPSMFTSDFVMSGRKTEMKSSSWEPLVNSACTLVLLKLYAFQSQHTCYTFSCYTLKSPSSLFLKKVVNHAIIKRVDCKLFLSFFSHSRLSIFAIVFHHVCFLWTTYCIISFPYNTVCNLRIVLHLFFQHSIFIKLVLKYFMNKGATIIILLLSLLFKVKHEARIALQCCFCTRTTFLNTLYNDTIESWCQTSLSTDTFLLTWHMSNCIVCELCNQYAELCGPHHILENSYILLLQPLTGICKCCH